MQLFNILSRIGNLSPLTIVAWASIIRLAGGNLVPPPADGDLYDVAALVKENSRFPWRVYAIFRDAVRFQRLGIQQCQKDHALSSTAHSNFQSALKKYQELENFKINDKNLNLTETSIVVAFNLSKLYAAYGDDEEARRLSALVEKLTQQRSEPQR